jgi:hypothetical protein
MFGSIQWVILSTIAMFFYPGGTQNDPSASGYTFWSNYFSDLGTTIAYSGEPNTVSQILFATWLFLWAFCIITFFIALPPLFAESRKGKWMSTIGAIFASISGIGTICVVFAPGNLYPELHFLFAGVLYLAIMLTEFFAAFAIYSTQKFSRKYANFLLISALITLVALTVALIGPKVPEAPSWLEVYVVCQKVITYLLLAAIGATAYGAWKLSSDKNK